MRSIIYIFLLIISVACYSSAGSIQGTVRNSVTLLPVTDVGMSLHVLTPDSTAYQTVTGINGKYKFTGIAPHNEIYVIIAYKVGYKECYTRIDRLDSWDLAYDIYLVPDTIDIPPGGGDSSFINGSIFEPVSGGNQSPVGNATITISSGGSDMVTSSDNNGKYKFKVPLGSFTITVAASGFNPLSISDLVTGEIGLTVNAILYRITLAVSDEDLSLPVSFELSQAHPNPFNPVTVIDYRLPVECYVKLTVSNILGQIVATLVDRIVPAGINTVSWDLAANSSSIYFYRLEALAVNDLSVSFVQVKRMVYIK